MKIFWTRFLTIYICWFCSLLSAQEISADKDELVENPVSFLEFVGWMERKDDLWITPFDLMEGFSIEEVVIPNSANPDNISTRDPFELVEP